MFKLNVHSIVDVITNSSTVIYTYQDSTKEAKELLQEILNLMGEDKKVDDLFNIGVFLSSTEYYTEHIDESEDDEEEIPANYPDDYKAQNKYIEDLIESILKGEVVKPAWMKLIEEGTNYNDFPYPTSLYISSKEAKYDALAKKILAFLNSVDADGGRDG